MSDASRAAGETERGGRPSTDSSRERPLSRGVAISDGPGEIATDGGSSCVGVAMGEVFGGELAPG